MARLRTFLVFLTVIAMYLCKYIESRVRVHDFSRARRRTMKLPFLRCGYVWATLFTAFYLCIAWGQPSFTRISENGCFCPAEKIVYQCTTVGSGTTRYVVTGCNREQLILLHSEFSDKGASGDCYNSTLGLNATAQSIRTDGTSYWSNLTVTVPNVTIIIQCLHENGTHPDPVGEPVTLIPAVPHEVGNITYTKTKSSLRFSWNDSSPPGCPADYLITSTNCGMCPSTTVATDVNCPDEQAGAEGNCSFSVRMRVCGVIGIPRSINISHGSTSTVTPPTTNGNAPSNGLGSATAIVIAVCVTFAVITCCVLIAVVIIVCIRRDRRGVKNKSESEMLLRTLSENMEQLRHRFDTELKKKDQVIEQKEQQIKMNQSTIQQNERDIEIAKREKVEMEKRITKENERELRRFQSEMEAKMKELSDKNTELQEANKTLQEANKVLQEEILSLRNTIDKEQKEHEEKMAQLTQELQRLNNAKASEEDVQRLQQQVDALQEKLSPIGRNRTEPAQDQKYKDLGEKKYDSVYQQVVTQASQMDVEKVDTYKNGGDRDHLLQDISPSHGGTQRTLADDNNDVHVQCHVVDAV